MKQIANDNDKFELIASVSTVTMQKAESTCIHSFRKYLLNISSNALDSGDIMGE